MLSVSKGVSPHVGSALGTAWARPCQTRQEGPRLSRASTLASSSEPARRIPLVMMMRACLVPHHVSDRGRGLTRERGACHGA